MRPSTRLPSAGAMLLFSAAAVLPAGGCAGGRTGPPPPPPPPGPPPGGPHNPRPPAGPGPASSPVPVLSSGLSLPHRTRHGLIEGEQCEPAELAPYLTLLRRELSRYPEKLLRRAGIRRICVAKRLNFDGRPWTGIPVFEEGVLWLDAVRGRHVPNYQARLIHHELFHLIDKACRGDIRTDPDWASLNPGGFRYGPGGENYQNTGRDVFAMLDRTGGFLTGYSVSAVEEDKAEVFSCLAVLPAETARRASRDRVLAAKIELLRSELERFCPGSAAMLD